MKTITNLRLWLPLILLLSICVGSSSSTSDNDNGTSGKRAKDKEQIEIKDLAIHTLHWSDKVLNKEEVFIIRSQSEFQNLLKVKENIPEVDFDKYSIVVISGATTQGIRVIKKNLYLQTDDKYMLYVDIYLIETDEAPLWAISILVSKMDDNTIIDNTIKTQYYKGQ